MGLFGPSNTVGGTDPRARNILSGDSDGIVVGSDHEQVLSNYIGTDVGGNVAIGNGGFGLDATNADHLTFGIPGAGNILSASAGYGAYLAGDTNLLIQGNYVGTDRTGTHALPNVSIGILIYVGSDKLHPRRHGIA